jgi:hypothetical protein
MKNSKNYMPNYNSICPFSEKLPNCPKLPFNPKTNILVDT